MKPIKHFLILLVIAPLFITGCEKDILEVVEAEDQQPQATYTSVLPQWGICIGDATATSADITDAHFSYGRTSAKWAQIQSSAGAAFYWGSTDAKVASIKNSGAIPVVCISNAPDWAVDANGNPTDHVQFANFCLTVIQRYNSAPYNVNYFEIYNEPDLTLNKQGVWTTGEATRAAAQYIDMLWRAWTTSQTYRNNHPDVKLIGTVLSATPVSTSAYVNAFYDYLWTHNVYNWMDILSIHIYSQPNNNNRNAWPELGTTYGPLLDRMNNSLSKINTSKPVWVTEGGFTTSAGSKGVSEANQARYSVRQAVIIGSFNWVKSYMQYCLYSGSGTDDESQFGIIRNDKSRKPAYNALKTMTSVLDATVSSFTKMNYDVHGVCKYKYVKNGGPKPYGWVVWNAEPGASVANGLGAGTITGAVYTRGLYDTNWTYRTTLTNGTYNVTATNDPQYVEVR